MTRVPFYFADGRDHPAANEARSEHLTTAYYEAQGTVMNPTTSTTNELQLRYADDQLNHMYDMLDELHNAASEGQLQTMTTINEGDLIGLLREMIYTAQETISEIEKQAQRTRARASRRNKPDARAVYETRGAPKEVLNLEPLLRLVNPAQEQQVAEGRQA